MNEVISDTPSPLRAPVQGFLARKLVKDPVVAIELLENARRNLPAMSKSNPNRLGLEMDIVRLYATLKPAELPTVFKEAMKTLDRIKYEAQEDDGDLALTDPMSPISIPSQLAQDFSSNVDEAVSAMKSTRARILLRLGLLQALLLQKLPSRVQDLDKRTP